MSRRPVPIEHTLCYTVKEFCDLHRISLSLYYRMRVTGVAPREIKAGGKSLISREEAERWRRDMEALDLMRRKEVSQD